MVRCGRNVRVYIELLLASCVLVAVNARIYYRNVLVYYDNDQASKDDLMERGFGFRAGGSVQFSMTCPTWEVEPEGAPILWLLFCSTADAREYDRLVANQITFDCRRLHEIGIETLQDNMYCQHYRIPHNQSSLAGQYEYKRVIPINYFYRMMLLQCKDLDFNRNNSYAAVKSCQTKLTALNPGDEHLSVDELPMPVIYIVINIVWGLFMAIWFFNWVICFKYSNRLHQLISIAPIFKVILVVLTLRWWEEIKKTGMEPRDIYSVQSFIESIEDALLFVTMMVIAEGWGVVRCHIQHYRWTSLLLLFVIFATSLMCVHWVHRYFLAFSVCCVVFMMYKTLKWCSYNIELIRRRRRKIHRFITRHNLHYKGRVTIDMQLCTKLAVYLRFRIICATFSMVYAIAVTLATFLQEFTYIKSLTFEIPELLVYLSIGMIFRLRNFEQYENIELVPPKENVVVFELPDVCFGQVDPHVTLGQPVHFKVEKETQTPRRRWMRRVR